MSDENREMETGETGIAAPPSVGSQLKAAREAKKMSVGDIAMALKLGPRQVEALENGDWQGLPGQTFIRGFVRNYARLLQIDPAPLMGQLDAMLETSLQRVVLPEQKRQATMPQAGHARRRDLAMAGTGVALVGLAAAIYFLWPADFSGLRSQVDSMMALFARPQTEPAPAQAPAPAAPAPQAEPVFPPGTTPQQVMNPQAVTPPEAAPAAPPAPAAVSPALVPPPVVQEAPAQKPAAQPQPQAQPEAQAAAPAGQAGTLHFAFEQDSWVEVRDRQGKVLFSQLNRAGSEHTVDGQGPFTLVIGNAPGVKLSLRGKPVDLASRAQGKVARLTLE